MVFPQVELTMPSSALFRFPPNSDPLPFPPPHVGSFVHTPPLSIPSRLFSGALDVKVPVTIACLYAAIVTTLNAYNRSTGNKPWGISKWKSFFWFVVAHNVFLAVYSGWTFVGMLDALRRTVKNPMGELGLVGTVDSLCKVHGIDGLGNAVAYSPERSAWVSQSSSVLLTSTATPDSTDSGRLWNEGLAFYGWLFYLSKFYEVLDTAIILAKGKKSSTLQTYHHAGAMMCMWAGIRFMSPPIWMFVFVNSGIHTLMYTYYTLTAFSVAIPQSLKRSLTTLQIIQFLVGVPFATIHSFVSYTTPIQVPIASSPSSAAPTTSAGIANLVKKLLFRAAGEEGLAENIHIHTQMEAAYSSAQPQFRTEYQTIPCIDTSGQTFALWLNAMYLAPLTVLFCRFFVRSYTRMASGSARKVGRAGEDAVKGVVRKANGAAMNGIGHVNGNGHINGSVDGYANRHANGHAKGPANGYANGKAH